MESKRDIFQKNPSSEYKSRCMEEDMHILAYVDNDIEGWQSSASIAD